MQKKICQLKNQKFSQNLSHYQQDKTQGQKLQQTIMHSVQPLDPDQTISILQRFQQNSHSVFCQKAELYTKIKNYKQAFENCQKALEFNNLCQKCLTLYISLYEVLLPRKIKFVTQILNDCEKIRNLKPQMIKKLKKIKESQISDQPFQYLYSDLILNGAQFSKLSVISENSDNRSVVARAKIQKDQTILFVPKNKLILLQNAQQSEIVKKIHSQKLYLRSPKHSQLTIFLLQQNQLGQKSLYWHYIKSLPQKFDTFPTNYKQQQLDYLKGSPFLDQVLQKFIDMERDYDAICSVWPNFCKFKFEDFKMYRLIVSSRIFGIIVGKHRTDALVPLADMLNHHIPKQTSWFYSDQNSGFIIKSVKQINEGQEIYDSYGQKCNSRFLLNYGFTVLQNEVNQVSIKIPFQYQEDQKHQIYRQITLKISKSIQSKEFIELISILRFSVMQQASQSEKTCLDTIKNTPFINIDVEAQIWQKFEKILQSQLQAYPTTLKQDRKILNSKDLPINYYNCIVLRMGQKQILHFYLTMSKKMIKYMRQGISIKSSEQLKQYQNYLKQLNFS